MKKLLFLFVAVFICSCDSKKEKTVNVETTQETVPIEEVEFSSEEDSEIETAEDIAFEKALEEVAIGGENLRFEESDNGKLVMSFDIATLQTMAQQIEQQRANMQNTYTYDSDEDKKTAIEAINMSLAMFEGEFCCTTHNGKHCEDSKKLKTLETKYNCARFKKKS
ncbi:hypothetical protein IMCC3317_33090 [Kordia antarctica]|uniref:Uncharacterized protein n=1 Tax=Kordia antarctica TaxID=1218801 RepID=A0A7L4ZNZ7_9FLAO|nr:hypothetical protein [Kordia antarctica]QHI37926.1 hypothetical protein IMCC3317_33090 [Kordia antarctica]